MLRTAAPSAEVVPFLSCVFSSLCGCEKSGSWASANFSTSSPPSKTKLSLSNPAHHLCLYSSEPKNILYTFKWLKKPKEEESFVTHKNYVKFKFHYLKTKFFLEHSQVNSFIYYLWLPLCFKNSVWQL